METLDAILARIQSGRSTATPSEFRGKDPEKSCIDSFIRLLPGQRGHDCGRCENKGYLATPKNGRWVAATCGCMSIRETKIRIEKSGLGDLIEKCTFDSFATPENWQKEAKSIVMQYADCQPQERSSWLFVGGQVGAGKTHLCTAAVSRFLDKGKTARYMLWRDSSVVLKALVTDEAEYAAEITPLKTTDVLYIDDFFKTERGKQPTTADINLAFEILNYRYNRQELLTIISSELLICELLDFDEAVGSRIYQRTAGYRVEIQPLTERNYRLKDSGNAYVNKRL